MQSKSLNQLKLILVLMQSKLLKLIKVNFGSNAIKIIKLIKINFTIPIIKLQNHNTDHEINKSISVLTQSNPLTYRSYCWSQVSPLIVIPSCNNGCVIIF